MISLENMRIYEQQDKLPNPIYSIKHKDPKDEIFLSMKNAKTQINNSIDSIENVVIYKPKLSNYKHPKISTSITEHISSLKTYNNKSTYSKYNYFKKGLIKKQTMLNNLNLFNNTNNTNCNIDFSKQISNSYININPNNRSLIKHATLNLNYSDLICLSSNLKADKNSSSIKDNMNNTHSYINSKGNHADYSNSNTSYINKFNPQNTSLGMIPERNHQSNSTARYLSKNPSMNKYLTRNISESSINSNDNYSNKMSNLVQNNTMLNSIKFKPNKATFNIPHITKSQKEAKASYYAKIALLRKQIIDTKHRKTTLKLSNFKENYARSQKLNKLIIFPDRKTNSHESSMTKELNINFNTNNSNIVTFNEEGLRMGMRKDTIKSNLKKTSNTKLIEYNNRFNNSILINENNSYENNKSKSNNLIILDKNVKFRNSKLKCIDNDLAIDENFNNIDKIMKEHEELVVKASITDRINKSRNESNYNNDNNDNNGDTQTGNIFNFNSESPRLNNKSSVSNMTYENNNSNNIFNTNVHTRKLKRNTTLAFNTIKSSILKKKNIKNLNLNLINKEFNDDQINLDLSNNNRKKHPVIIIDDNNKYEINNLPIKSEFEELTKYDKILSTENLQHVYSTRGIKSNFSHYNALIDKHVSSNNISNNNVTSTEFSLNFPKSTKEIDSNFKSKSYFSMNTSKNNFTLNPNKIINNSDKTHSYLDSNSNNNIKYSNNKILNTHNNSNNSKNFSVYNQSKIQLNKESKNLDNYINEDTNIIRKNSNMSFKNKLNKAKKEIMLRIDPLVNQKLFNLKQKIKLVKIKKEDGKPNINNLHTELLREIKEKYKKKNNNLMMKVRHKRDANEGKLNTDNLKPLNNNKILSNYSSVNFNFNNKKHNDCYHKLANVKHNRYSKSSGNFFNSVLNANASKDNNNNSIENEKKYEEEVKPVIKKKLRINSQILNNYGITEEDSKILLNIDDRSKIIKPCKEYQMMEKKFTVSNSKANKAVLKINNMFDNDIKKIELDNKKTINKRNNTTVSNSNSNNVSDSEDHSTRKNNTNTDLKKIKDKPNLLNNKSNKKTNQISQNDTASVAYTTNNQSIIKKPRIKNSQIKLNFTKEDKQLISKLSKNLFTTESVIQNCDKLSKKMKSLNKRVNKIEKKFNKKTKSSIDMINKREVLNDFDGVNIRKIVRNIKEKKIHNINFADKYAWATEKNMKLKDNAYTFYKQNKLKMQNGLGQDGKLISILSPDNAYKLKDFLCKKLKISIDDFDYKS